MHDPSAPPLEHGLDVFHTAMEATGCWPGTGGVPRGLEKAEQADVELARAKPQGIDARGAAEAARAAWRRASAALEEVERLEVGLGPGGRGAGPFDADGRLNDRDRATAAIAGR